jgi:hypothetical protein
MIPAGNPVKGRIFQEVAGMNRGKLIQKWSLFAGGVYFLAVSTSHMLGIKVPMLFVYFNVPSQAYQDRIISFLAFGWGVFFITAFNNPQKQLIRAILIAGAGAIIGLVINNLLTDFQAIAPDSDPAVFWAETAGLLFYWLWLLIFHILGRKSTE